MRKDLKVLASNLKASRRFLNEYKKANIIKEGLET